MSDISAYEQIGAIAAQKAHDIVRGAARIDAVNKEELFRAVFPVVLAKLV